MRAAVAGLERRRWVRGPRRAEEDDPYTLRGHLFCAHCGGILSCTKNNSLRRYTCLRGFPSTAELQGREHCPLPQVPADALERHVGDQLALELLSPRLRENLERAGDGNEAARRHQSQLDALRTQIDKLTRRIERATEDIYNAEEGSATEIYAREARARAEQELRTLRADYADLEGRAPVGLTADGVDAIVQFVDDVRAGIQAARDRPAEQGWVLRRLNVTGRIGLADDGVKLARKHRFATAWDGLLELPSSGKLPLGSLM
jgi:hypothetical protein